MKNLAVELISMTVILVIAYLVLQDGGKGFQQAASSLFGGYTEGVKALQGGRNE